MFIHEGYTNNKWKITDMAYDIDIQLKGFVERKLKNIKVGIDNIGASVDKVNRKDVKLLRTQLANVKAIASLEKGSIQAANNMATASINANKLNQNLNKIKNTARVTESQFKRLFDTPSLGPKTGVAKLTGGLRSILGNENISMAQAGMFRNMQQSLASGKFDRASMLKLGNNLGANLSNSFLDSFEKNVKKRSTHGGGTEFFKKRLASIGSYFGIYTVARTVMDAARVQAQTDTAIRTITATLPKFGVKGTTPEMMKYAKGDLARFRREAAGLGIDPYAVQREYSQFMASSSDDLQTSRKNVKAFMMLSKVYGLSGEETKGMFYALTQMQSKGVVSMEELRRQFGERVPGALRLAAESMGMTQATLQKKVETGTLESTKLIGVMSKMIEEKYGGMLGFLRKGDLNTSLAMLTYNFKAFKESLAGTGPSALALRGTIAGLTYGLQGLTAITPLLAGVGITGGLKLLSKYHGTLLNALFGVRNFASLKKGIPALHSIGLAVGSAMALSNQMEKISMKRQQGEKITFGDYALAGIYGATGLAAVGGGLANLKHLNIARQAKLATGGLAVASTVGLGKLSLLSRIGPALTGLFTTILAFLASPVVLALVAAAAVGTGGYMAYKSYKGAKADVSMNGANKNKTQMSGQDPIDINLNVMSYGNTSTDANIFNDNGMINVKYNYSGGQL